LSVLAPPTRSAFFMSRSALEPGVALNQAALSVRSTPASLNVKPV
jgi:hypothetical protein